MYFVYWCIPRNWNIGRYPLSTFLTATGNYILSIILFTPLVFKKTEKPGGLQSLGSQSWMQLSVMWERVDLQYSASFRYTIKWMCYTYTYATLFGESNGTPLQYCCLENPVDEGAWWAAVYGVAQSQKGLKQLSSSSMPLSLRFFPHIGHYSVLSRVPCAIQ